MTETPLCLTPPATLEWTPVGQKFLLNLHDGLDDIDRRIRVLSLSDNDLVAAKEALTAPIFEKSDYWLKVIDDELLRREMFPCI
ncbi:hypothetical protein [Pelagibacterium sediminicola]|uniref:hypothetical protein n=1 Tax=Pelagibacterium sediminicola TaxID=2248761 RepID=UPI001300717D|nr:hypothetical protein [Pelagibacterium sediminicola]